MIKELLKSKSTFATPIVLYLFDALGMDALTFESETIAEYLKQIEPSTPQALIDRTNAALGLFNSDLFWNDPVTFGIVCRSLNRNKFPMGEEPSMGDMAWGVSEATLLCGDVNGEDVADKFSESIVKYVRFTFKNNAVYSLPKSLDDFGPIPYTLSINDPEMAAARQFESDQSAASIDLLVTKKMLELFLQIKKSQVRLDAEAEKEIDTLIKHYQDSGITI